jgi:TPR repeat protein
VPEAAFNLAMKYRSGTGVENDLVEGAKWLRRGVELGDDKSLYYYGLALRDGKGIAKNMGEAIKHLKLAAEKGVIDAVTALASIHRDGANVEHD